MNCQNLTRYRAFTCLPSIATAAGHFSLGYYLTMHKQCKLSSELHCTTILQLALQLLGALSDGAFDIIHLATVKNTL